MIFFYQNVKLSGQVSVIQVHQIFINKNVPALSLLSTNLFWQEIKKSFENVYLEVKDLLNFTYLAIKI